MIFNDIDFLQGPSKLQMKRRNQTGKIEAKNILLWLFLAVLGDPRFSHNFSPVFLPRPIYFNYTWFPIVTWSLFGNVPHGNFSNTNFDYFISSFSEQKILYIKKHKLRKIISRQKCRCIGMLCMVSHRNFKSIQMRFRPQSIEREALCTSSSHTQI